jgi:hypothetical protein
MFQCITDYRRPTHGPGQVADIVIAQPGADFAKIGPSWRREHAGRRELVP